MKEILLTCPFTGCQFTATIDLDNNLYVKHPLTGEINKINYNCSIKKYNVPKSLFKPVETVTLAETAEILGVSRQRASAIGVSGVIAPKVVNGQTVFLLNDVLAYRDNRKVGAPARGE